MLLAFGFPFPFPLPLAFPSLDGSRTGRDLAIRVGGRSYVLFLQICESWPFFFEQIRKRTWSHFACACACEASWAFLIMDLVYAASRVGFLVEQ